MSEDRPKRPDTDSRSEAASELEAALLAQSEDIFRYEIGNQKELEENHQRAYGKTLKESFVENWKDYLVEKAEGMDLREAFAFARVAYNVFASIEFTIFEQPKSRGEVPEALPPKVMPESGLRQELNFNDIDYRVLHGALMHKPLGEDFYKIETAAKCLDHVVEAIKKQ